MVSPTVDVEAILADFEKVSMKIWLHRQNTSIFRSRASVDLVRSPGMPRRGRGNPKAGAVFSQIFPKTA